MTLKKKLLILAGIGFVNAQMLTTEAYWPYCLPPDQDPQVICQWQLFSQQAYWDNECAMIYGSGTYAVISGPGCYFSPAPAECYAGTYNSGVDCMYFGT
jgi:hypothetical protein